MSLSCSSFFCKCDHSTYNFSEAYQTTITYLYLLTFSFLCVDWDKICSSLSMSAWFGWY